MEIVIIAGILMGTMIALEMKKRAEQDKGRVPVRVDSKKTRK